MLSTRYIYIYCTVIHMRVLQNRSDTCQAYRTRILIVLSIAKYKINFAVTVCPAYYYELHRTPYSHGSTF